MVVLRTSSTLRGGDQVHPFVAVADMDMAAVRQIIGVQRTQQGRFAAAGVTVEHHALPGVNGQRGVGQHRQTHAVLLVQNKGFMDVFNADHVSSRG
jgi:hypothetical protein